MTTTPRLIAQRSTTHLRRPYAGVVKWHDIAGNAAVCNWRIDLDVANAIPASDLHRDFQCDRCRRILLRWKTKR